MSNKISRMAKICKGTKMGQYCIIGPKVKIGAGCQIGNGVIIHPESEIGADVRLDDNAVIGKQPACRDWNLVWNKRVSGFTTGNFFLS